MAVDTRPLVQTANGKIPATPTYSVDPAGNPLGGLATENTLLRVAAAAEESVLQLPPSHVTTVAEHVAKYQQGLYAFAAVSTVQNLVVTGALENGRIDRMHLEIFGHAADNLCVFKSGATVIKYVFAKAGVPTYLDWDFQESPWLWTRAVGDDLTITPAVACSIYGDSDYAVGALV